MAKRKNCVLAKKKNGRIGAQHKVKRESDDLPKLLSVFCFFAEQGKWQKNG